MKMKHFSLKYVSLSLQLLNLATLWPEKSAIYNTGAVFSYVSSGQWMNLPVNKSRQDIEGGTGH